MGDSLFPCHAGCQGWKYLKRLCNDVIDDSLKPGCSGFALFFSDSLNHGNIVLSPLLNSLLNSLKEILPKAVISLPVHLHQKQPFKLRAVVINFAQAILLDCLGHAANRQIPAIGQQTGNALLNRHLKRFHEPFKEFLRKVLTHKLRPDMDIPLPESHQTGNIMDIVDQDAFQG